MNRFPLPSTAGFGLRALVLAFVATGFAVGAKPALAQYGTPGMMPGMPPPQPGMGEAPKEEGPAEAAPEEEEGAEKPPELEPLGGYAQQQRKRTQLFELNGYFRFRGNQFNKLNLGIGYLGPSNEIPPPFPVPLDCGDQRGDACDTRWLGSADMRFRLEPVINVTEQVRVLSQIDVLDNVVAGSTPDSLTSIRQFDETARNGAAPADFLANRQDPPEVGRNGLLSSIRAKRAWGEVDTQFGSLRFGRMPWHFGRGMLFNNGNCFDCDFGTNVDRLMALTQLYGHQVMLSWDFGAQGPNTGWTNLGFRDPEGPVYDLSQRDDVYQLTGAILRVDEDARFRERASRGEVALNYGVQLTYRDQTRAFFNFNENEANEVARTGVVTRENLANSLTRNVDGVLFLPDVWFKLGYRILTVEFEAAGAWGKMDATPTWLVEDGKAATIRQLGWVLASDLALYKNSFFLGFETGGATGDQQEENNAYLNYRWRTVRQPGKANGDGNIGAFHFSPDYHVDQILFRRILGTVTNAVYFKPQLSYWFSLAEPRQLGITAAAIYSGALVPVSTPGNSFSYGLELNTGLTYRNPADGFYAGFTWAVLFPFGGLDRLDLTNPNTPGRADASTAMAFRLFAGIRF